MLASLILNTNIYNNENFENKNSKFIKKNDIDIYDEYYCNIYDDVLYDKKRIQYEIHTINKLINKNSIILDIGCGQGDHTHELSKVSNKLLMMNLKQKKQKKIILIIILL